MSRNKAAVKANRERTEREKLKLFVDKVNELRDTNLLNKGFDIRQNISWRQGNAVEFSLKEPDEGEFRDYLVTFRRFVSNEDVQLNRVFNICHRRLINNELKQQFSLLREAWSRIRRHSGLSLIMDGSEVTSEKLADIWLNGRYFHDDLEHRELLDSLPPFILADLRFKFLNFVVEASRLIIYMGRAVDTALHDGSLQFDETEKGLY